MGEFFNNIKGILRNSPLILSDTKDVSDVSLNRITIVVLTVFLISAPLPTLLYFPQFFEKFIPLWNKVLDVLLALLLVYGAGRTVDKFKKGGNVNDRESDN